MMRALFSLAIACIGCASNMAQRVEEASTPRSVLIITNERTDDAWIWLARSGEKTSRVGLSRALRADTLTIPSYASAPGAMIGFIAVTFASGLLDVSDEIVADRGVAYMWQLGPAREHGNLWYRRQ
jgi:hypothetical protein